MISDDAAEVLRWLQEQHEAGKATEYPFFLAVDPINSDDVATLEHLGLDTGRDVPRDLMKELLRANLIAYDTPRWEDQDINLGGHFNLTMRGINYKG